MRARYARRTAVCAYAVVMYKVLRVNGRQTGREPRINERNFGTCGMPADVPRFICIQACSIGHASSSVVFTRVSRVSLCSLRRRTKEEKVAKRREREREKEKRQDTSSALSSAAR